MTKSLTSKYLLAAAAFVVMGALWGTGCASNKTLPIGRMEIPMPNIPLIPDNPRDFRGLSWSGAFNAAIIQMQKEYAYGDWRGVDWDSLRERYAERIAEAEETQNNWAYYMALRGFVSDLHDGLVEMPAELSYKRRDLGGGYGITVVPLVDDALMVVDVDSNRYSLENSVQPGATLLRWDNKNAWEALHDMPLLWAHPSPATKSGMRMAQAELLSRAPIGSTSAIGYQNPGRNDELRTELTAIMDGGDTQRWSLRSGTGLIDFATPIESKLVNNYGYIKINFLSSTLKVPFPTRAFQGHVQRLIDQNMRGLIIDLRGNAGGDSTLPPKLLGHFVEFETFYRDLAYRDDASGRYGVRYSERVNITPATPHYKGPIVVLVDHATFGAAEMMAHALRQLPRTRVVGFASSHGTPDVPTEQVVLPGSHRISYPVARAVDESGRVIIAGNSDGVGGVQPDVIVPLNRKNAQDFFISGSDVVLAEAVRLLQQGGL